MRRDGESITIHDEVETNWHEKCLGVIFVVAAITPHDTCESGFMVSVHVKDNPERKLKGLRELGLDTNWFRKIKKD